MIIILSRNEVGFAIASRLLYFSFIVTFIRIVYDNNRWLKQGFTFALQYFSIFSLVPA